MRPSSIPGLGDEYEVTVDKVGDADRIRLRVEFMEEGEDRRQEIEHRLVDQLRLRTNLRYDLEFCSYGELPRFEVKAKRFKDLRRNH